MNQQDNKPESLNIQQPKFILDEVFADNGEHSHWSLIDASTGVKVWSEDPEECKAQGHPVKLNKLAEAYANSIGNDDGTAAFDYKRGYNAGVASLTSQIEQLSKELDFEKSVANAQVQINNELVKEKEEIERLKSELTHWKGGYNASQDTIKELQRALNQPSKKQSLLSIEK